MALIDFLKKKKEQIDKAIPDLNIKQKAGQAVRQVGKEISNIERASQQAGLKARQQVNRTIQNIPQPTRTIPVDSFKSKMQEQGIGGGRQFAKELFNLDNIRESTGKALYENKPLKILRGVADFVAPITTGRNFIRTTNQAIGAGLEEPGLRKEQKAIDIENQAISKLTDTKEALRRARANSERARKLTMLREEKKRTVNVLKVLADTALFAGDTALSATGTKAAIKAGKPAAKKVFNEVVKRSGQRAGIGAGFGAGTSISEGERDVKQIAKQAGINAAANVALGKVIDVAPSVVSKAGQKIQTALDQPKFQPGFASTKPKVSIEPKQPRIQATTKVDQVKYGGQFRGGQTQKAEIKGDKIVLTNKDGNRILTKVEIPISEWDKANQGIGNANSRKRALLEKYPTVVGIAGEGADFKLDPFYRRLKDGQAQVVDNVYRQWKASQPQIEKPTVKITQPKTEAPVVKLATTETPEQLAKKAVGDIPGFEPAIEAKPAKATRIEPTSALTRLQEKPQSNIIVKSKNNNVPDLTEIDVQQIAKNTKRTPQEVIDSYGNLTNRVSETSKKPIANIQASLTDFIRSPKKWENQFVTPQKVLTSQSLDEPETLARQTLDKVIPEKVFGKEPALKSTPEQKARFEINQATRDEAIPNIKTVPGRLKPRKSIWEKLPEDSKIITDEKAEKTIRAIFGKGEKIEPPKSIVKIRQKPESFEDTITRLATEAAEKAKKEPISPEIAPVARVSTKADIKVSPEAKIDDRFPINRNLDRGEKINYDDFIEKSINAKSEVEKNILERYLKLETADIANEYNTRTGKQFQNLVDELESGNLDKRAGTLYDEVSNILNASNKINEVRNKQVTGKIENYFLHKSQANVDEILSGKAQRNTGNILYTAGFGKKRTGALTEYAKTPDAMVAYWLESMGPLDEASSGLVRTANQIKNAIQKNTNIDTDGNIKSVKDVDYFSFVKDNMFRTGRNKYENVKTNYFPGTRSVKNRVFQLADRKFYDDFLEAFLDAQQFYDNAVDDITKLNKKQLENLASGLNIGLREGMSKNELRTRIDMHYKKEFFGPASEKFIKNVANIDTRDPNTIRLINDIAEEYIGNEVRKLSVLERATGGLRLLNAMGVLGLNISTAVQNVLETKKTFARTGIKNTSQALLDYFQGKSLKKKYGVHSTSNVFEDEGVAGLRQVAPLVFTFSNITEDFKDRVFLSALEKLGQSKGLDGNDLKYFVRSNFEQFGIKMGRGENIGLFSGKKGNVIQDIPKTAFQFMQFPIKDTVALVDTLEKGFSKFSKDKKMNEDLSTVIGYMGLSAVQALVLGGLGGVGVSALLDRIGVEGFSKSEDKENILQRGLLGQIGFGSQTGFTPLDFITQISRGDITGPQVDLIANIYKYAQAILAPESDRKEEELNKARQEFNRSMLVTFIPTTNQLYNKTWKYYLDRERGYFETRGKDKNVANLTTENAWGMIRAFMFGGSYDPERQEYIRKIKESKSPNLGEQESAIFKEVKERQGIESAKQFFEGIMTKREADKALEQLEKGAEAEKPKGMSEEEWSKVKATSEAYITSGLATTDDFVNYFARNIDFDKTGAERTKNESKIFTLINEINDDDKYKKLSPEQKEEVTNALLEKSKIPKDIFDYYNKAKRSVTIKYQTVLEELDKNLSENPNFDIIDYLVQGRRNINGSRLASQEVLKLLEKDGVITNDQYKALNKLNFIYLDGEFKDKSTKPSEGKKGKGGKGKRQRITLKSLMAGEKRLSEIPKVKDTIPLIKLKTRPRIAAIKLQKTAKKPVVKLAPSRKAQTKKLTIRNIRVK